MKQTVAGANALCGALIILFSANLISCMTPSEKRLLKSDVASVQARLLEIENRFSKQGQKIAAKASMKTANTNNRIERLNQELNRIKGDIDALRVGVVTGQMPGMTSENQTSIASTIDSLSERMAVIEENQINIMAAIEAIDTAPKKKKNANSTKAIRTYSQLKKAFKEKRYQHVADYGARVIREQSKVKRKQEAVYLYAESLYKLGRLRDAALKFNEYIELKPQKNAAHAKMRMGDCFRHLGDKATARIYYEELIEEFGSSSEAKEARKKLAKMN
jgi:TolA-binding protein